MSSHLSHLDKSGKANMVDISQKPETQRIAIAKGEVCMQPETLLLISEGNIKKGDVSSIAQIAGIMAAKRTADLIPLCHSLPLNQVKIEIKFDQDLPGVLISARVSTHAKTGVEMEALTAVVIAALTVYDMAKSVDKKMCIQNIRLVEKHGGLSGDIIRE